MSVIEVVIPDGSMQQSVINLFENAGLSIMVERRRTGEGNVEGALIKRVVFQRPQEIPQYLECGYFDVGIVGEDWIVECGYTLPVLHKLPIGRAGKKPVKIILAVSQASDFQKAEELPKDCVIATEYINLTKRFFSRLGRDDITVIQSYGNTEHKIKLGLATAIVDVTESGNSLRENNLRVIAEIMESAMAIAVNPQSLHDASKREYIRCFADLINGAFQASKYVLLVANTPESKMEQASRIIGGLKGPSCSPIFGIQGWFALQSIIKCEDEQDIILKLRQIGVTDIFSNRDIPLIMSENSGT